VEPVEPLLTTVGLPVILSINNFVPAPIAAPVSAFTTLLVVELGLVVFGLTVGFTTDVGDVVFVVGVVDVLFVIVGFVVVVGAVVFVVGVFVFDVSDGLVFKDVFVVRLGVAVEGLVVSAGLFVAGLVNDEVNGRVVEPADVTALEPPAPPADVIDETPLSVSAGALSTPRMMLPSGARSSPLASGSCLLDVRFFRIAMSYPDFLTCDVRPAMFVTGLNFAVLASFLGGAIGVAFCIGISFATSMRGGGGAGLRGAGFAPAICKPPAGRGAGARGAGRLG
jgi:hypothetical protein